MEDTIDLRPYFGAILRYWWVIIVAAALAIVIAASLYSNQTDYKATAWVAISEPSQRLQFDPRIESTQEADLLLEAYPELALTDELLIQLLPTATERTAGAIEDLTALRSLLSVETASAPRLMRMTVKHADPQLAADLANLWAERFAAAVENIYRNPGGQVEFYQAQLAQSDAELRAAEEALVAFQARSRQGLAQNELNALLELQVAYLADQRALQLLLADIQALRSQLLVNSSPTITYADQLTALTLQMEAYDSFADLVPSQFQFQLNPTGDLTTSDRATQLQLLDELSQAVEASLNAAGSQLPALESQIFMLQSEYQVTVNEFDRLTRQREVAQDTYDTLARKLDEVRIGSEDQGSDVQIASRATVPTTPARTNPIILFGAATVLGGLLAVAFIAFLTWRRTTATTVG
jgi:uncharacterized protein involved in exopolysaccharide biosynthesis